MKENILYDVGDVIRMKDFRGEMKDFTISMITVNKNGIKYRAYDGHFQDNFWQNEIKNRQQNHAFIEKMKGEII